MTIEALIFDAIRTPRGKGKKEGKLHEVKPINLVVGLLHELQQRYDLDTSQVDDVVMGCVTPVNDQGGNLPKTAALVAGWADSVAGVQLNRFCASGLEAVNMAAQKVRSGWDDLVVAGGIESMSRVAMGADGGPMAFDAEISAKINFVPQGIGADLIATLEGFSREDLDRYAVQSQQRAAYAHDQGYFKKSLVPVKDVHGEILLDYDELIRETSMESLAKLNPSFQVMGDAGYDAIAIKKYPQVEKIHHVHTPGNSSGIVDGSALVLIGSEQKGKALGLKARGRVVATAVTSTEPTIMLTGPAPATLKALQKANMKLEDIDLFELNEAFAAVVLKFQKELSIPSDRLNVNGGAIAMGHPLGATGAMLIGIVLDELERRRKRYGLITLCVGGGMGIATIIEAFN